MVQLEEPIKELEEQHLKAKFDYAVKQYGKSIENMDINNKESLFEVDYWRTRTLELLYLLLKK